MAVTFKKLGHTNSAGDSDTDANEASVEQSAPEKNGAKKHNNTLPVAVREKVVVMLATGHCKSEVKQLVEEEDGIVVSVAGIGRYDPRTIAGDKLKKELKELFYATYRKHIERLEEIPMAHASVRLQRLDNQYEACVRAGDRKSAINALKEARVEMRDFEAIDEDDSAAQSAGKNTGTGVSTEGDSNGE